MTWTEEGVLLPPAATAKEKEGAPAPSPSLVVARHDDDPKQNFGGKRVHRDQSRHQNPKGRSDLTDLCRPSVLSAVGEPVRGFRPQD